MRINGIIPRINETGILSIKDLVASCKPKNNVIIAGIKPNNVKR